MLSLKSTISSTQDSTQNSSVDIDNFIQNNSGSSSNINQTLEINEGPSIRKRRACFALKLKRLDFVSFCAKADESPEEKAENSDEIESLISSSSSAYNSGNETYVF